MSIQTVFKAGNSEVVAIPKAIIRDLNIKPKQKVVVEMAGDDAFVVRKVTKISTTPKKSAGITREFKKWLEGAMKEDAEILDELA